MTLGVGDPSRRCQIRVLPSSPSHSWHILCVSLFIDLCAVLQKVFTEVEAMWQEARDVLISTIARAFGATATLVAARLAFARLMQQQVSSISRKHFLAHELREHRCSRRHLLRTKPSLLCV